MSPNLRLSRARMACRISLSAAIGVCGISRVLAAEVVALGASNTIGIGVEQGEDFPSQLEGLLRAKGFGVKVLNAGVNGDSTSGMLWRLDGVIGADTKVLVLQPGGNDTRSGFTAENTRANVAAIREKLAARRIKLVIVSNDMFRGSPFQSDLMHLTPDGYRTLAKELLPKVLDALRR